MLHYIVNVAALPETLCKVLALNMFRMGAKDLGQLQRGHDDFACIRRRLAVRLQGQREEGGVFVFSDNSHGCFQYFSKGSFGNLFVERLLPPVASVRVVMAVSM